MCLCVVVLMWDVCFVVMWVCLCCSGVWLWVLYYLCKYLGIRLVLSWMVSVLVSVDLLVYFVFSRVMWCFRFVFMFVS